MAKLLTFCFTSWQVSSRQVFSSRSGHSIPRSILPPALGCFQHILVYSSMYCGPRRLYLVSPVHTLQAPGASFSGSGLSMPTATTAQACNPPTHSYHIAGVDFPSLGCWGWVYMWFIPYSQVLLCCYSLASSLPDLGLRERKAILIVLC